MRVAIIGYGGTRARLILPFTSSPELAAEYRNQLYNGDFYVDCSVGGAQYGQGMYCAADYTGKGYNAGIDAEMKHYQSLNIARQADNAFILGCSTSDLNKAIDEMKAEQGASFSLKDINCILR